MARQVDLFRLVNPVGDLNRELGWGFLALAREKNTQRQHNAGPARISGPGININKELTRCIQMVIIMVH